MSAAALLLVAAMGAVGVRGDAQIAATAAAGPPGARAQQPGAELARVLVARPRAEGLTVVTAGTTHQG